MSEALALAGRIQAAEDDPYAWIITRDRDAEINGGESYVNTMGPCNAPDNTLAMAGDHQGVKFRLLDEGDIDDCNYDNPLAVERGHADYGLVYEGFMLDPSGDWPFGPLDDFGRPNYGCIEIQHWSPERNAWIEI